jgi:hypothetical protein
VGSKKGREGLEGIEDEIRDRRGRTRWEKEWDYKWKEQD